MNRKSLYIPDEVKRIIMLDEKREKYYAKISKKRFVSYDDYMSNSSDTVISNLDDLMEQKWIRESAISALRKSLKCLSDSERQIINECFFFEGKKRPTYTSLALKHGISCQAYSMRVDRILKKLKTIVKLYLEND